MKKLIFPLVILIFISTDLSAQRLKDVLYLQNGSIIYGTLMEISDKQYKIKTTDGSLFIFSESEVEKYVKEAPTFEGRIENGFGFAFEAGFLVGSQSSQYSLPFSFNFQGKYTFQTLNSVGVGSGVEFIGQTYTPLFAEYKHLISDKKNSPFLFLRGGGLIYLGDDQNSDPYYYPNNYNRKYRGGASLTAGTGISWCKEDFETYLSFAYRFARTSYEETSYNGYKTTYKTSLNRLEIKFGFIF